MLTTPEQGDGDVTVRRARASRINRGGKRGVKSLCQLKLNSSVLSIISSQSRREQRQGGQYQVVSVAEWFSTMLSGLSISVCFRVGWIRV